MEVKVNDILAGTWGYSMTLVNFFKVVRLTPKQVVLRELRKRSLTSNPAALIVEPGEDFDHRNGEIRLTNKHPEYIWHPRLRSLLTHYDPSQQYVENHMD